MEKKSKKKKPAAKSDSWSEPFGGDIGGGPAPWDRDQSRRSRRRHWRPQPRLSIRQFPSARSSDAGKVQALAATVDADPTNRKNHSRLVRTAMALNHPEAVTFARAWANVDPDHAGALESLADALARDGAPIALRAYESVVEIRPFSSKQHTSLAHAYENEGDFARACSHRRALVSIKPTVTHQAGLVACLQRAGRTSEAASTRDAFVKGAVITRGSTASFADKLDKAIRSAAPATRRRGQLKATLTWSGSDELDVAIIDRSGRRISVLHDRGAAKARESRGREELDLTRVRGSVFVEVSRRRSDGVEGSSAPLGATLELVTPNGRKTIPVSVGPGSTRVAKVFWTRG